MLGWLSWLIPWGAMTKSPIRPIRPIVAMLEPLLVVSLAINHNKSHSKLTNCISKRKQHVLHPARRLVRHQQDHQSDRTRISQHLIHLLISSSISHTHTVNTNPFIDRQRFISVLIWTASEIIFDYFTYSVIAALRQIFISQQSKYRNQLEVIAKCFHYMLSHLHH